MAGGVSATAGEPAADDGETDGCGGDGGDGEGATASTASSDGMGVGHFNLQLGGRERERLGSHGSSSSGARRIGQRPADRLVRPKFDMS